jgi:hypothetical protein
MADAAEKSTFDTIMASLDGVEGGDDSGDTPDPADGTETEGDVESDPGSGDAEGNGGDEDDDTSGPGDRNDAGDDEGGEEDDDEPVSQTPEEKAVADAAAAAAGADEFDKLLDEYGFRAPKAGKKDYLIPQSRVRARVKTALKKHAGRFEAERTALQGQVATSKQRVTDADTVEAMINEGGKSVDNARKYLQTLAAVHPAYGELLKTVGESAPSEAMAKLGAMPGPDVQYEDGSVGYSPAQLTKRDEWLMSKAALQARESLTTEFNSRMTPIEKERAARAQAAKDAPVIEARLQYLRKTWGSHFVEDEKKGPEGSEILKYQRDHKVPFLDAVAAVILPKMVADRTKMRQEILKELKGKKAKAGRVVSQSSTAARQTTDEPQSTGQTILAALEKAGL